MTTPDLVIANGRIVDGCGNPWYYGDVAVRGDGIAAIGAAGALRGRVVVDAGGRYVAPGFVDPHTHSDISILQYPRADSVVRQGVTTHVTGNCGMSPAPLGAAHRDEALHNWAHYWDISRVAWDWTSFRQYLKGSELAGGAINIAPLVGHGALRLAVVGLAERAVTERELAGMERLLDAAMRAGAHGLSTGLVYPPGCFSDTEELVRLCRVVARYRGIYTTHVRGERETILEAVAEAIAIGRRAGVPSRFRTTSPSGARPRARPPTSRSSRRRAARVWT